MGYTHYWTGPRDMQGMTHLCQSTIQTVLQAAYVEKVIQLEFDDPAPPVATQYEVRFNGIGDDGHETFLYHADGTWAFCKTARKLYDEVVMKVLLLLAYHHDVKISSDGSFNGDLWTPQRRWLEKRVACRTYVRETLEITP